MGEQTQEIPESSNTTTPGDTGPVFLRTVLKRDVFDRLKELAKEYSTGRGDWDFGVAIQVLLENYENSKQPTLHEKMDMILFSLSQQEEPKEEPSKKEEDTIELLGGYKIKKGEN